MDFLRQLYQGILKAWRQLSLSARINIVLAALSVVAIILFVVFNGAQTQYVTLTKQSAPEDSRKIVELLQQQDIPYKLEDSNRSVLVPLEQRSDAQLLLADNDLPIGRRVPAGFELFQETDLMTNQWNQDIKFMRALQGELQRQLNAFDFIEYSLVIIREAEEELFVAEQQPSEAAVTLEITRPLTKREVKGIVSLISRAGGVNLHPGNITVSTTSGEFLHLPPQSEFASIANSKLELTNEWEAQREAKLSAKLKELGVRGTVSVSAMVNFEETEVTAEKISEGTELSTYAVGTTIESTEKLPEGAPGAFANVPEGAAAPGGASNTEETTEEITNYEPSRTVTRTKTDPGNVQKYLVSLIIEGDYEESTDEQGNTVKQYVGLSDDRRQAYSDLAKATVGEGEVATEVLIHDHPFDIDALAATSAALEEMNTTRQREWMLQLGWQAAQILAIIFGFFLIRMLLKRAVMVPVAEEEEEVVADIPEATREDMRRQDVAKEVARMAQEEPEMMVALLRSWINEEEE